MGMDVHGLNPKQNKKLEDFPILHKYKKMEEEFSFNKKWKELDADEEIKREYSHQDEQYQQANKGVYFRSNCWWWRPLWDFCYQSTEGIIPHELWERGHHNNGVGLDSENAEKLGKEIMLLIADGTAIRHEEAYKKAMEQRKKIDKNDMSADYPFDVVHLEEFAHFCLESGGFEIW